MSILLSASSCDLPNHYFESPPECYADTIGNLEIENQKILIANLKFQSPKDYRYFFKSFTESGDSV